MPPFSPPLRSGPRCALRAGGVLAILVAPGVAQANPRSMPFTYPYETLPAEAVELEQYIDLVPVRVVREGDAGSDAVTSLRSNLETEIEYALTDHVELAWYTVFSQGATAAAPALRFQGVKQRVRFRFAEMGDLPINLGLYLEVGEFYDEFEFEEKLLLSRRFGRLNLAANLWVEQEYNFQEEDWRYLYNPTVGVNYQVTPGFTPGLEYWARGRFGDSDGTTDDESAAGGARHYGGPTMMFQSGNAWIAFGAYLRWDNLAESARVDDPWGKVFVRALMGIGL